MSLQSDFMVAINQIAAERNIEVDDILDAIKQAIRTSFKKDETSVEEGSNLNIEIDKETGKITVYADKKVVKEVTDEMTQISLKEAQSLESKLREGDHVEIDITPEGDFGRVAAQAAKQVILQKLREIEKESQVKRFVNRVGEIEMGIVQRMDGDGVLWEIGKASALMPLEDRIPNEFYRSGAKHKVLLREIRQTPRGKSIIVSRAHPDFLKALFYLEIPELSSEAIEIKAIAREAGQRTKVAVASNGQGIDPIGACVGQKGSRIMAIMNELKIGNTEEKIDIILWDEDEQQFVTNALSPAQVIRSKVLDPEKKIIMVVVPDDQLSLAIGRDGQNVRLAAKLTGWNIDIQGETVKVESTIMADLDASENAVTTTEEIEEEKPEKETKSKSTKSKTEKTKKSDLDKLELSARVMKSLANAGIESVKDLKAKIKSGEKIEGVGPKAVEEIQAALA